MEDIITILKAEVIKMKVRRDTLTGCGYEYRSLQAENAVLKRNIRLLEDEIARLEDY